jgi:predicted transcriptional regulator
MAQEHEGRTLYRDRLARSRHSGDHLGTPATVRDVYETLREQRQIAYTTVMTVMNNLVKKELLTQDRTSIAYVYTPAIPGNEVASTILDSVVARLFRGRSNIALSHLLGLKRDLDPGQAEQLREYAERHFAA